MECHLVVYQGRVEHAFEAYESSGNVVLNKLLGATFHTVNWEGDRNSEIKNLSQKLKEAGKKPFSIPYGVSSGIGAISYSTVVMEIAQQSNDLGFSPNAIIGASGSGGTQAGLVVGASNCLPETRIIGVDVDAEPERVQTDVIKFACAANDLLNAPFDSSPVEVMSGFAGPAYGIPHPKTIEAMKLIGRLEAIILDPVYTGKAFAALLHLIREGHFSRDDNVVFVHTGGMPATFAYSDIF